MNFALSATSGIRDSPTRGLAVFCILICVSALLCQNAAGFFLQHDTLFSTSRTTRKLNIVHHLSTWTGASGEASLPVSIWAEGVIDYSAANEYVRSHYNHSQYFDKNGSAVEPIYDARVLQSKELDEKSMLKNNGIALLKIPEQHQHQDWASLEDVRKFYLPELENIISILFPSTMMHCFWNPMMRSETSQISRQDSNIRTPTANIAPMLHIDTDVGAHDNVHELLNIVEKNKLETAGSDSERISKYTWTEVADAIVHGNKRFVIVNFWRNIGDSPIARAPLAILSTRYDKSANSNSFPNASPDMNESKFYVFPKACNDEVIAFYQYDRDSRTPSDLWHCATSAHDDGADAPRTSFDIRALIVLNENIPIEFDRYISSRTKPFLSFEESECFCDEQAAKREKERSSTN